MEFMAPERQEKSEGPGGEIPRVSARVKITLVLATLARSVSEDARPQFQRMFSPTTHSITCGNIAPNSSLCHDVSPPPFLCLSYILQVFQPHSVLFLKRICYRVVSNLVQHGDEFFAARSHAAPTTNQNTAFIALFAAFSAFSSPAPPVESLYTAV